MYNLEKLKFFLPLGEEYAKKCAEGKVWAGSVPAILFDAALVSLRLNYWRQIEPRVKKFYEQYVVTGKYDTIDKLAELDVDDRKLKNIIKDKRPWILLKKLANALRNINNDGLDDYSILRIWAKKADVSKIKSDPIGSIKGIGIVTFQELRRRAGVSVAVPDSIIKRVLKELFDFSGSNESTIAFIENLAKETGYSESSLCSAMLHYYAYKNGYLPAYLRPKQKSLEVYKR